VTRLFPGVRNAEYRPRDEYRLTQLAEALSFAVPLWIQQVRLRTAEEREQRQQRNQPNGGCRVAAFTALAECLALAAFDPGGVTYLGMHWSAS
jgi:hypothetical protein